MFGANGASDRILCRSCLDAELRLADEWPVEEPFWTLGPAVYVAQAASMGRTTSGAGAGEGARGDEAVGPPRRGQD